MDPNKPREWEARFIYSGSYDGATEFLPFRYTQDKSLSARELQAEADEDEVFTFWIGKRLFGMRIAENPDDTFVAEVRPIEP